MKRQWRMVAIAALPATVEVQAFPGKPIRFLTGFPPGGTNDIVA